jgi:HSP20 family molecular chaperone IbpA
MVTTNGPTTTPARTPAAPDLTFQPTVDICDRGTELLLVCDVPGARPDGIDVTFEDGVLAIQAAVPPRELPGSVLRREYGVGNYRRSFRLGEGFDASLITADYQRGVITIRVPRLAAVRPRKIAVRTA